MLSGDVDAPEPEATEEALAPQANPEPEVGQAPAQLTTAELAANLEKGLQADSMRLMSLTQIAYSTERMVDRTRGTIARSKATFLEDALLGLNPDLNLEGVPLPKEALLGLMSMAAEQACQVALDRVRREAAGVRVEAAKLEGSMTARQELLAQLRPPGTSS